MAGLDSIIEQISKDSAQACQTIKAEAEANIKEIRSSAEAEILKENKENAIKATKKAEAIVTMAESGANLDKKNALLSEKVNIMDEIISDALKEMKSLPEDEYFKALYSLADKYVEDQPGTIILSKKDKDRLPKDFLKNVNKNRKNPLKIADETRDLDGGFVLAFGQIELNLTFDALVAEAKNDIKDDLYQLIFA